MKEQIEEMRKDLIEIFDEEYEKRRMITPDFTAEKMTAKGYRKEEWISVDERLPEKGKHVLCLYPQKDYGSKVVVDYAETADGFFAEQYLFGPPSHWMPLPEPPKMKGGAE